MFQGVKHMGQRLTALYLARKELSVVAIHRDLAATFGEAAVSYSSMTRCLREAIFLPSKSLANIPEV
jgi:hypothetical protein